MHVIIYVCVYVCMCVYNTPTHIYIFGISLALFHGLSLSLPHNVQECSHMHVCLCLSPVYCMPTETHVDIDNSTGACVSQCCLRFHTWCSRCLRCILLFRHPRNMPARQPESTYVWKLEVFRFRSRTVGKLRGFENVGWQAVTLHW